MSQAALPYWQCMPSLSNQIKHKEWHQVYPSSLLASQSLREHYLLQLLSKHSSLLLLWLLLPTSRWLSTYFWFQIVREHVQCRSHITQLLREIEVYHLLLTNPSCSHWQLSTFNGWLLSLSKQTSTCRDQGLHRPLSPRCTTGGPSLLSHLMIPKHSFISAKVLQYFVREIERTQTMETIRKMMKSLFGRSQTYHCCSRWHQPYQSKQHWTHQLHWTH